MAGYAGEPSSYAGWKAGYAGWKAEHPSGGLPAAPSTAWSRLGEFWLALGAFWGSFWVRFLIQKKRELKYEIP